MASDLIGSCGHLSPILPRSLQRPLASTDGIATRKANRNGVRLWTTPSFYQDRETGGRHRVGRGVYASAAWTIAGPEPEAALAARRVHGGKGRPEQHGGVARGQGRQTLRHNIVLRERPPLEDASAAGPVARDQGVTIVSAILPKSRR